MSSPNGTIFYGPGASVMDAAGDIYTITASGQITIDGKIDPLTAGVEALAFFDGATYQKNNLNLWYSQATASYAANGWTSYAAGAHPVPFTASPNDTLVAAGSGQSIIDANGDQWTIAGGKVVFDGTADPLTANVVNLGYVNGIVWQENASGRWWSKTGGRGAYDGWSSGPGTFNSIGIMACPVPGLMLTWVGGGNNLATNLSDYATPILPGPGDWVQDLISPTGTINIAGPVLNGVTLGVGEDGLEQPAPETINISGASTVTVSTANGASATINLAAGSVWSGSINTGYSAPNMVDGAGSFANVDTQIDSTLTVDVNVIRAGLFGVGAGHDQGNLIFMKSVSAAQVVDVAGGHYGATPALLQIDHPSGFLASVSLGLGSVLLEGLNATSYSLAGGMFALFNGNTQIDSMRLILTAPTVDNGPFPGYFSAAQVGSAVVLTNGLTQSAGLPQHVYP